MPFKAAKCPNCAGDIQVPDDRDTAKCMYCGSDIIVREAIRLAGGKNLQNIFAMAKNALTGRNKEEGLQYINSYLEEDQANAEAWDLKAQLLCLEYEYTDVVNVLSQVATCMSKAIALDNKFETSLELYKASLAESMWPYINTNIAKYNEVEQMFKSGARAGVYYHDTPEVKEKIRDEIFAALQLYIGLLPEAYHKDAIPKIKQLNAWLRSEGTTSPGLDNFIQKYDSQYTAPPAKACFIATATYGSSMAPDVIVLRKFRDRYLERTIWGRKSVDLYYHISPSIAKTISKSNVLKTMTKLLLKPIIILLKSYRQEEDVFENRRY